MAYPNRQQINYLVKKPEYFADEMTVDQIDKVIAAFIETRNVKTR